VAARHACGADEQPKKLKLSENYDTGSVQPLGVWTSLSMTLGKPTQSVPDRVNFCCLPSALNTVAALPDEVMDRSYV
jgi:hypothetical protein